MNRLHSFFIIILGILMLFLVGCSKSEIEELNKKIAVLEELNRQLEIDLKKTRENVESLNREKSDLKEAVSKVKDELKAAETEIAQAALEKKELTAHINKLERELQTCSSLVNPQITDIKNQLRSDPENKDLYIKAGNIHFDNGLFKEAIGYYEQAIKLGGENPDVLCDMGICYRNIGKPEEAVAFFARALKTDSQHVNSAFNMGVVYYHDLKNKGAALEAWETYLDMKPLGERADMIRKVVRQLKQELGVQP